jgi:hypothetical protein
MNCRQNMDTDSGGVAAAWLGSLENLDFRWPFINQFHRICLFLCLVGVSRI